MRQCVLLCAGKDNRQAWGLAFFFIACIVVCGMGS